MGAVACFIVALDCAQQAVSDTPRIFTASAQWIWWVVALVWILSSVRVMWREIERA